jgi:hypothetical protein
MLIRRMSAETKPCDLRLLRPRRDRPRHRRAAEQRDELAAPDASCHLTLRPEGGAPTIAHAKAPGGDLPSGWLKMKSPVAECQKSSPEWSSKKCKLLFRASVTWLTHPLPVLPYVWNSQEADMALQPHRLEFKPHRFEFILAMVLAMALTILAITTWAAPANPDNDSAASIPPIYRPDHRNLY